MRIESQHKIAFDVFINIWMERNEIELNALRIKVTRLLRKKEPKVKIKQRKR